MDFKKALKFIKKSKEVGLQLDFFRENGQVLLQVFKQEDVLKWGMGVNLVDNKGLIIGLTFHKAKINNQSNRKRFENSDFFNKFFISEKTGPDSFFYGVDSKISVNDTIRLIKEIFNTIYNINDSEGDKVEYTLNAY